MAAPETWLVTGASGYLGQFVVQDLAASGHKVGCTYRTGAPPVFDGDVSAFKVDLSTGEGLEECFDALGPLTAVVHCAAQAALAACELDEAGARAINIPSRLLDALERRRERHGVAPFLVHISTDHVYEGSKSFYKEGDELRPVNKYGRSKVDGEREVAARWPRHVVLRPSIIFGPPPANPTQRGQFLQGLDANLAAGKQCTMFSDEWRTPTYVNDLVAACRAAVARGDALPAAARTFNVGCPERLNRVDMAIALAEVRGHDARLVAPGSSASVASRVAATPGDISMDCSAAEQLLGLRRTPFKEALREIFAGEA